MIFFPYYFINSTNIQAWQEAKEIDINKNDKEKYIDLLQEGLNEYTSINLNQSTFVTQIPLHLQFNPFQKYLEYFFKEDIKDKEQFKKQFLKIYLKTYIHYYDELQNLNVNINSKIYQSPTPSSHNTLLIDLLISKHISSFLNFMLNQIDKYDSDQILFLSLTVITSTLFDVLNDKNMLVFPIPFYAQSERLITSSNFFIQSISSLQENLNQNTIKIINKKEDTIEFKEISSKYSKEVIEKSIIFFKELLMDFKFTSKNELLNNYLNQQIQQNQQIQYNANNLQQENLFFKQQNQQIQYNANNLQQENLWLKQQNQNFCNQYQSILTENLQIKKENQSLKMIFKNLSDENNFIKQQNQQLVNENHYVKNENQKILNINQQLNQTCQTLSNENDSIKKQNNYINNQPQQQYYINLLNKEQEKNNTLKNQLIKEQQDFNFKNQQLVHTQNNFLNINQQLYNIQLQCGADKPENITIKIEEFKDKLNQLKIILIYTIIVFSMSTIIYFSVKFIKKKNKSKDIITTTQI